MLIADLYHWNCPFTLVFDPYQGKCPYACAYCYAGPISDPLSPYNLEALEHLFEKILVQQKKDKLAHIIQKKVPLRVGFFTDPFPPSEEQRQHTRKLLTILEHYQYPSIIITKSALIASDKYLDLLSSKRHLIQISVDTLDNDTAQLLTSTAPPPSVRLDAIHKLATRKIPVVARINPLILNLRHKDQLLPYFTFRLLDEIKAKGACGVILGRANLSANYKQRIQEKYGVEIIDPPNIWEELQAIQKYAQKIELPFSFCHLGTDLTNYQMAKEYLKNPESCCYPAANNHPSLISTNEKKKYASLLQKVVNWFVKKITDRKYE